MVEAIVFGMAFMMLFGACWVLNCANVECDHALNVLKDAEQSLNDAHDILKRVQAELRRT